AAQRLVDFLVAEIAFERRFVDGREHLDFAGVVHALHRAAQCRLIRIVAVGNHRTLLNMPAIVPSDRLALYSHYYVSPPAASAAVSGVRYRGLAAFYTANMSIAAVSLAPTR